jgi:hypothetical protein
VGGNPSSRKKEIIDNGDEEMTTRKRKFLGGEGGRFKENEERQS